MSGGGLVARNDVATFMERFAERVASGPALRDFGAPINRLRHDESTAGAIRSSLYAVAQAVRAGVDQPEADWPKPAAKGDYASIEFMAIWAAAVMARSPDFVIGEPANPYLRRWWVIPRNDQQNVYLHEILRSDDDRALHDHPWPNTSWLLSGRYVEHLPNGEQHLREAGWIGSRDATAAHRLEILPGERAVSLFLTGPKVRDWGFHCPNGWVPWREFTGGENGELVGKGCGE